MSKKDPWYRQCTYERVLESGNKQTDTSWIPEDLAKVGKRIYFGKKVANPVLWTVIHVGSRERESWLIDHERDYQRQRKASDI